jgi:RNA polymerase sigma factor (sigma-70 family)
VDANDFTEYRPLMFSIAYRMTGGVSDAEDIVQDAFLRLTRALRDGTTIASPKAFLATVTTRLAISHLRSARVRREAYVGAWLPEPLIVDDEPGPAERAEMSDSLSMAFLVLLESLSTTGRSQRSPASPSRTAARSSPGQGGTSTRAAPALASPASRPQPRSATRWPAGSSPPLAAATWPG